MAATFTVYDADDYGIGLDVTMTDDAGAAQDVSAATAVTYLVDLPNGRGQKTWAGAFINDGTDGRVRYTLAAGDLLVDGRHMAGEWKVRVRLTYAASVKTSAEMTLKVVR